MNCGEIEELAPLWHSGELDEDSRKAFDAHTSNCPACAASLREQWAIDARLRAAIAAEPADTTKIEANVKRQIGREKLRRWMVPGVAVAAALIAAVIWQMPKQAPINPAIFADAARDHTAEVINQSPRRWRTDPVEVATLEKNQGIDDADVKALEATGYTLQRAKVCRLGGAPYMHLVYGKEGREFSVYLKVREEHALPEAKSTSGNLQLASFAHGRVQAVIVSDAPKGECAKFTKAAEAALL